MAVKAIVDGLGREHQKRLVTLAGTEVVRALKQAGLTEQLALDVGMQLVREDLGREVLEDTGANPDGDDLRAGVELVAKDVIKEWRSLAKGDDDLRETSKGLKAPKASSQLKPQGNKLSEAYQAAVEQAIYDELRQLAGPTLAAKVQRHDADPITDAVFGGGKPFEQWGTVADMAIFKELPSLKEDWAASALPGLIKKWAASGLFKRLRQAWGCAASQIKAGDLVETPADIGIVQRVFKDNGEAVAEVELLRGHHAREIFPLSEMTLKQTAADVDKQTLKHDLREAEPNWRTTFWLTRADDFTKEAKRLGFTVKEDNDFTVGSLTRYVVTGDPRKLWQLFMRVEPIANYAGRPGAPGSQELRDVIPDVLKPEALKRAKSYGLAKDTIQSIAAKLATMGYTLKPLPYDLRANSAMYLVTDRAGQSQRLTSKQVQQLAKGKSVKAMVGMGDTLMASLSPEAERVLAVMKDLGQVEVPKKPEINSLKREKQAVKKKACLELVKAGLATQSSRTSIERGRLDKKSSDVEILVFKPTAKQASQAT